MPQVIGLDVGARSVKAALFERGFRGLELIAFHKVDIDPTNPEATRTALGTLAARMPGAAGNVVARLPGDRLLLRMLELPIGDLRKLEQVVPFELEQMIPIELDELVLDFGVVKRTADGGSRILAAGARKIDVRDTLDLLVEKGLEPRYLSAGAAALGTLVQAWPALGQGTVAIVDAGFARTDVCLLDQGRIAWARTLSGGFADLAGAHADGGGAVADLAQLDVSARGTASTAASSQAADFVAREIRRTLLAAENETHLRVDRIALVGGLARVRGFAPLLERAAGSPVETLALSGAEWARNALPAADEAEAAAAVALAFRAVADAPLAAVNFRKDEFAFKRDVKELSGVLTRMVAMVAALLALAFVNYMVRDWLLTRDRANLDKRIADEVVGSFPEVQRARLTDPDTALSIMRGSVADARDRLAQLGSGGLSALDVLSQLSAAVPPGMYVDVKKFVLSEDGKAQVQANVDTYQDQEKLVDALKKVSMFQNVESGDAGTDAAAGKKRLSIKFDVVPQTGGGAT